MPRDDYGPEKAVEARDKNYPEVMIDRLNHIDEHLGDNNVRLQQILDTLRNIYDLLKEAIHG